MKQAMTNAVDILNHEFAEDIEYQNLLAEERVMAQAARSIYLARKSAKLSQEELANLVGTRQSVISRLENGDYEGHSLAMLQRIATALHQRIELHFVPIEPAYEEHTTVS